MINDDCRLMIVDCCLRRILPPKVNRKSKIVNRKSELNRK
jgi:hypothetical protein